LGESLNASRESPRSCLTKGSAKFTKDEKRRGQKEPDLRDEMLRLRGHGRKRPPVKPWNISRGYQEKKEGQRTGKVNKPDDPVEARIRSGDSAAQWLIGDTEEKREIGTGGELTHKKERH